VAIMATDAKGCASGAKRKTQPRRAPVAPAQQAVTSACTRAEDGFKRVEISAEWVCIRRRIAGMDTWVNVPTASYRGVTLKSVAEGGMFEIVLLHMDPSLEIILSRTSDDTDIIALWRSYARTLALPLLIEDRDGRLQPVDDAIAHGPFERRFGSPLKDRRPRFLARRHPGSTAEQPVHLGEYEMFAAGWGFLDKIARTFPVAFKAMAFC
jgi:Family of unknown function (DUF6101)